MEQLLEESRQDRKPLAHMNQVIVEAWPPSNQWIAPQIVLAWEQKETAPMDKIEVQRLVLLFQQVAGGGIYRLNQICIAPFSNSRSIHSHPVTFKQT